VRNWAGGGLSDGESGRMESAAAWQSRVLGPPVRWLEFVMDEFFKLGSSRDTNSLRPPGLWSPKISS